MSVENFCNNINGTASAFRLYRILSNQSDGGVVGPVIVEGGFTKSEEEKLEAQRVHIFLAAHCLIRDSDS